MELVTWISQHNHHSTEFLPNVSGYRLEIKSFEPFQVIPYIWIEEDYAEHSRLNLINGKYIELQLGDLVCRQCKEYATSLENGFCEKCTKDQEEFFTRMYCLYDRSDSQLNIAGKCEKDNLACKFPGNKQFCHSKYVFYIGRIGKYFKAGISRKNRTGTYKQRLAEQGLHEALVIEPFSSLPEVLEFERFAASIGIPDRIHFDEKVAALQNGSDVAIHDLWQDEFWDNLAIDKSTEYFNLYQDFRIPTEVKVNPGIEIAGVIEHVQGPVLVLSNNEQYEVINLRDLIYREIYELTVSV